MWGRQRRGWLGCTLGVPGPKGGVRWSAPARLDPALAVALDQTSESLITGKAIVVRVEAAPAA